MTTERLQKLPRAYLNFSELFSQFDAPMTHVLGGILSSFASRLNVPFLSERQPQGDFVGFDGISNTGELAHLLESDWLTQELDPNDFVRRVAEREVLYRRQAFEDSGSRNTLAVVLDCGPWMLGRNRLCALAALFYLAVVAERSGSDLKWAVPGQKDTTWSEGLTRENVTRFLGQIVQGEPDQQQYDRLLSALEPKGSLHLWYVGAEETALSSEKLGPASRFLIQRDYTAENTANVLVHTARRKTAVDILFPDEATCVAALRRPFKPVVRASTAKPSKFDMNGLSKLPYHTMWQLDRFNRALLLRLPEGLFWQSLDKEDAAIWIPLKKEILVLGVSVNRVGRLNIMLAKPKRDQSTRSDDYFVTLLEFSLPTQTHAEEKQDNTCFGVVGLNPGEFPAQGLPSLCLEDHSFIQSNGKQFAAAKRDDSSRYNPSRRRGRVLFCSSNYLVEVIRGAEPELLVTSLGRNSRLLRRSVGNTVSTLAGQKRTVLFDPSSKVVTLSDDGYTFSVLGETEDDSISLEDGQHLLQLNGSLRGIVWNDEKGVVQQMNFRGGAKNLERLVHVNGEGIQLPRHCPVTGTIFALRLDSSNNPSHFVPIFARRGWGSVTEIDIPEAIQKARVVWPAV